MQRLLTILILLFSVKSFACRCSNKSDVATEFANSEVVIIVKVLEKLEHLEPNDTTFSKDGNLIIRTPVLGFPKKVEVLSVYKGKRINKIMTIKGVNNTCESYLGVGKKYIIYGRMEGTEIFTNACKRTDLMEGNPDIEYLIRKRKKRLRSKSI